jgi:hypothetical protein
MFPLVSEAFNKVSSVPVPIQRLKELFSYVNSIFNTAHKLIPDGNVSIFFSYNVVNFVIKIIHMALFFDICLHGYIDEYCFICSGQNVQKKYWIATL